MWELYLNPSYRCSCSYRQDRLCRSELRAAENEGLQQVAISHNKGSLTDCGLTLCCLELPTPQVSDAWLYYQPFSLSAPYLSIYQQNSTQLCHLIYKHLDHNEVSLQCLWSVHRISKLFIYLVIYNCWHKGYWVVNYFLL